MRKLEVVLTLCGVLLMALAAVLLVTHSRVAECVGLIIGHCEEAGFAYEAGGKLALLLAFSLFLAVALLGVFQPPRDGKG